MRCDEFYQKWKKHPNFCEKSPESVRLIDFYLSTVDEVVTQDLDESAVYVGLSERAARPLFKEKDPKVRAIVIANIAGMIKRGQKVSAADVTTWIEAANPTMVGTRSPEPAVKPAPAPIPPGDLPFEKWSPEYKHKYPVTTACRIASCALLQLEKPGLYVCSIVGMRPENMPKGKLPDGCPKLSRGNLPPIEPEPAPAPAAPPQRALVAPPSHPNLQRYTVEADRQDQMAIRQMVQRGLAEDEDEAVQSCFEEGLNLFMDRIEAQVQKETEDQEVLGE